LITLAARKSGSPRNSASRTLARLLQRTKEYNRDSWPEEPGIDKVAIEGKRQRTK
jgi:hypothetical protein